MALPALPAEGNQNWYTHYAALDAAARNGTDLYKPTVTDISGTTGVRSSTTYLRGDGTWATPTSTSTTTTGRSDLWPEDFGYNTAGTDAANQTAMQNFVNAITAGKVGVIRAGLLYKHNALLTVPTASKGGRLVIDGELQATVPTSSGFKIQADGFKVEGSGKVTAINVVSRGSTLSHQKISIDFADSVQIRGITVDGSHATGFFSNRGTNYLLEHVTVKNTQADGFHNTNGSTGGRLRGCTSDTVGDDGVAVVSYQSNGVICSDIDVQGHTVKNGGSRGAAVVGGTDIRVRNLNVEGCGGAGGYIAAESSFSSYGCTNVRMRDLTINSANQAATDHGALMFFSSVTGSALTKCSFDFAVADRLVRNDAVAISGWLRVVESGTPGTSSELSFGNIMLRGAGPASNVQGNMASTVYEAPSATITRQATW